MNVVLSQNKEMRESILEGQREQEEIQGEMTMQSMEIRKVIVTCDALT